MSSPDSGRFDVIPYADLSPEQFWHKIGKGSFGSVYRGEYLSLEVAIKEVLPSDEYDMQKYLAREIQIMQESRHPNVVQYLGLCLAPPSLSAKEDQPKGQRILIISEYLTKGNVRSYIASRSQPFPWRLRMSFAIDVARAVAYMHARQCMHRDLKGENLLIADNLRIKVCDFGFARIAAKNEEEMRRMSYCGTDGYMSPEILMGLDFGLETDIFSLGIIFCEILCRRLVDGEFLKREMPSFGISSDELRYEASEGCPPALIALAAQCCEPEGANRPTIRTILSQLLVIEKEVLEHENRTIKDPAEKTYNIGSMNFGGMKTKKQLARPAGPGRIPSFEGRVKVAASQTSSNSDEAIEDVLKDLEDVKIAGGHEDAPPGVSPRYSTTVISRSSFMSGSTKATMSHTSSVATVRARPAGQGHVGMPSSASSGIPSIPSSWLAGVPSSVVNVLRKPSPSTEALVEDQVATKEGEAEQEQEQVAAVSDESSSSSDDSVPQTPEAAERSDQTVEPVQSFMTARTTTPSIAAATVNGGADEDYSFINVEDEGDDHFFPAGSSFDDTLHRFTLVKPGWKLFWTNTPAIAVKELKADRRMSMAEGAATKPDKRKSLDVGGKKAKSEGKCDFCDKSFGWKKPYMSCDDCSYKVHPKVCADLAPRNCGCPSELLAAPQSPKDNSSFAAKLKRKSKMASQHSMVTIM